MNLAGGLVLALVSAVALNWGWVAQHDAASSLPPLTLRRPVHSLALLFRNRAWFVGFVTGIGGWAMYVAAVALAPLSLVQAVAAGSVGLIAFFARRRGARVTRGQTVAVALSVAGLLLLALSLGGGTVHERQATGGAMAAWLLCSLVAATATGAFGLGGAAAGILYAAGDVATKGAVGGGIWLVLVPVVLAAHGGAFVALQLAFQRGSALASAGVSTLLTNALPIAGGIFLFHERVPGGARGVMRIAAFALVVVAAALLARPEGDEERPPRARKALRAALPAAALAVLAVAVRLPGVWHNALSQDEVASARILTEPHFAGMLHHVVRTESTPPLWYTLGWLTHHLGVPVVDVRLLSVLFGGLLAALVFELARTVVRPSLAAIAGALAAVGYEPVYHGSELRSYELLALLATLLCVVVLRHGERPTRRLDVALGATVWAGLLTHYFFVYSIAAVVVWLWLDPSARAVRRRATVAIAAGGLCAAPWLPAFLAQYRHDRFWWIGGFKPRVVLVTPLRLFVPYAGQTLTLAVAVLVVLAIGAAVLARSGRGRLVALLAIFPTLAAGCAWAAGERSYAVRNLIETAPFIAICVAAPLAAVRRREVIAAVAATAVTAVAVVAVTRATVPFPPYQRIARALVAEGWRPSDPVAVYGNFFSYRAPLEWYLPRQPLLDVSSPTTRACAALYVIERRGDDFAVEKLAHVRVRRLEALESATLLAATHTPPRCVRLSTNPRLEPLA